MRYMYQVGLASYIPQSSNNTAIAAYGPYDITRLREFRNVREQVTGSSLMGRDILLNILCSPLYIVCT